MSRQADKCASVTDGCGVWCESLGGVFGSMTFVTQG